MKNCWPNGMPSATRPAAEYDEDLLRQYERVEIFAAPGLAEVRDQEVHGMQVMLRPQTYNEVRNQQSSSGISPASQFST